MAQLRQVGVSIAVAGVSRVSLCRGVGEGASARARELCVWGGAGGDEPCEGGEVCFDSTDGSACCCPPEPRSVGGSGGDGCQWGSRESRVPLLASGAGPPALKCQLSEPSPGQLAVPQESLVSASVDGHCPPP